MGMGFWGLLISVVLFIVLTFKNWNVILVTIITTVLVALTNHISLWDGGVQVYASGFLSFVKSWGIIFLLGAVFGICMQETGLSSKAAQCIFVLFCGNSILAVLLVSLVLSYGGIGTFIIAFTVYPIATELFEKGNINSNILPATILFCPTTLCMTMLPGTPSIQNMIPSQFLGTNIYAAPLIGFLVAIVTFTLGFAYLHIVTHKKDSNDCKVVTITDNYKTKKGDMISFLPCVALWVVSFVSIRIGLSSTVSVSVAMVVGICITLLSHRNFKTTIKLIQKGTLQGLRTLCITSSIMGYGALVQNTEGFEQCVNQLFLFFDKPLFASIVSINVIAAITGSSTASLQLFFSAFSAQWSNITLSNQYIHRIMAIASGGLDSMPYATGVVVTSHLSKIKLVKSYPHIFVMCAMIPLISLGIIITVFC